MTLDLKVSTESPVSPAKTPLVYPELMVSPVQMVHQDFQVFEETMDHQAEMVPMVNLATEEHLETREFPEEMAVVAEKVQLVRVVVTEWTVWTE